LSEEVVAFDIENNRVHKKEDLPDFPTPFTGMLIKSLEKEIEKSMKLRDARKKQEE